MKASESGTIAVVAEKPSVARDIARAHGGDLTLGSSKLGGLRAAIRLPV